MIERSAPHLWMLVGPNGAGKSTYFERHVKPRFRAPFVNADLIARARWPDDPGTHARQAQQEADAIRHALIAARTSFVTETVYSHPSRSDLPRAARAAGFTVWLTLIHLASPELALARIARRVREGGHDVPEDRVRGRYARMPANVIASLAYADRTFVVDNSEEGRAFRAVYAFDREIMTFRAHDVPRVLAAVFDPLRRDT